MKTINITFSEENIEDLLHIIRIYKYDCLAKGYNAMFDASEKLQKHIMQCSK